MECTSCGATAVAGDSHCRLCGRGLATAPASGPVSPTEFAQRALSSWRAQGGGRGDVFAIVLGVAGVASYPWLLAAWAAQPPGSVMSDVLLATCWGVAEVYLLTGVVKAAQWANSSRRFATGLVVPSLSMTAQLVAVAAVASSAPVVSAAASVFGTGLPRPTTGALMIAFAALSLVAALLGAYLPRVVPGKFGRQIGPQLGCASGLFAALLLPTWGGLALASRMMSLGFSTLWVDIAALFVFSFFALYWFWPTD